MVAWTSFLPFLLVSALLTLDDLITTPSCEISGETGASSSHSSADLKVMMVADLLLRGSDASYFDLFIRDHFTSKFFTKSFQRLNPDMVVVLGDISDQGSKLDESKWSSILHQFHQILGSNFNLPIHVIMGDRDIGLCPNLNEKFISQISNHMPLLDSTGCSAFKIANISFLSLNSVALNCANNELRFSVERAVEKKNAEIRRNLRGETVKGPIVLLHLPLYKSGKINGGYNKELEVGTYDLEQTLPLNVTQYILQALKPRIVFSAHAHIFSDYIHSDGTREIIVPHMSWAVKEKPGFVLLTFGPNNQIQVYHCILAQELHAIMSYLFFLTFSVLILRTYS